MKLNLFFKISITGYLLSCLYALSCLAKETNHKEAGKPLVIKRVNVFLGSSGDHGQMSPSAAYPFSMLSIGPVTTPHNHTGYEYEASRYNGFVHTHLEGVGCTGSGGNILVKPILNNNTETPLVKAAQDAQPGYYHVTFKNGIQAQMTVSANYGIHDYKFPAGNNGLFVDLSFTSPKRFVAEEHLLDASNVSGWIDTKTTCGNGIYRIYYWISFPDALEIKETGNHQLLVDGKDGKAMKVRIGFSSVNTQYAKARITDETFDQTLETASGAWKNLLNRVTVEGEKDGEDLFYSLLYRGLQSPFVISENDGTYRAIDGSVQHADQTIYNGWAIWDNYREQLPMLSLFYPEKFADIACSIANLYNYGKKSWATMTEPSPTVRTEHAIVVLLDAWRKGYDIPFNQIKDKLIDEVDHLDTGSPDKALESAYDYWALAEILKITGDTEKAGYYLGKALEYQVIWTKDFADITREDVDRMQARGLYQGTIWQYRWFVPFDVAGLKKLTGGEKTFIQQLDQFFGDYNYNHANQPDLQAPGMYNATSEPWKSQELFHHLLLDSVVQCYFNDASKGIDPYIGRIYQNQPKAYLRTMDDDAGTMSSWFVMRSIGLSPANVGSPIYYLTAPVFRHVSLNWENGKTFSIEVPNYNKDYCFINKVTLNGKPLTRNWLTQDELISGGKLVIETSYTPNKQWGIENKWISNIPNDKQKN